MFFFSLTPRPPLAEGHFRSGKMSAAIAALASYGGSDSESDSGSDAEGRPGLSAQVAGADAVLHLAGPPPSAQQALLPVVDSAPAVSVKVRAGRGRTNLARLEVENKRFPVFDGRLGIPSPYRLLDAVGVSLPRVHGFLQKAALVYIL